MATRKEAEAARVKHAERLRKLGAHAIEVGPTRARSRNFAVIAHFEQKPVRPISKTLGITTSGVRVDVPLIVKVSPSFQPD